VFNALRQQLANFLQLHLIALFIVIQFIHELPICLKIVLFSFVIFTKRASQLLRGAAVIESP
jgi:hypothetical protein